MDGKYLIGSQGSEYLHQQLSNNEPAIVISNFQERYGLALEGVDVNAIYPLLEQSGMSRHAIHIGILNALSNEMIKKIEREPWDQKRYDDFLRKTLPMIHIKQLRAAILALLAKYPDRINSQLYEILSHNHFVLREAPLEVKRGFFVRDKNMFKDVIGSRVAEYQKDLQLRQMAREIRGAVVAEVLDARKNHKFVQEVVEIVNDSVELFDDVQRVFRELFTMLGWPSICSFRFDFFMAMQSAGKIQMCKRDPSFELIWFINDGLRKGFDDETRVNSIQASLAKYKRNGSKEFGDIAMIFQDPLVANVLASRIYNRLRDLAANPDEPQRDANVVWATEILNIGCEAHRMFRARDFNMPQVDAGEIYNYFYYRLLTLMLDDAKAERYEATSDKVATQWEEKELTSLRESEVCRKIFSHYVIERLEKGDIMTVRRVIPYIKETLPAADNPDVAYHESYESLIQTFISILIRTYRPRLLLQQNYVKLVDDFLVPISKWSGYTHQLVVKLLCEFFSEDLATLLSKRGKVDRMNLVKTWIEKICEAGSRDPKYVTSLRRLYLDLKIRSQRTFGGAYRITRFECPVMMGFLNVSD